MAVFDDIGKKISRSGQEAVKKVEIISQITKLKNLINEENKQIDIHLRDIGATFFLENYDKDNVDENYRELFDVVKESYERIDKYKEDINSLQDCDVCSKCGRKVPKNSKFCGYCGCDLTDDDSSLTCPACGGKIDDETVFCPNCGEKITENIQ